MPESEEIQEQSNYHISVWECLQRLHYPTKCYVQLTRKSWKRMSVTLTQVHLGYAAVKLFKANQQTLFLNLKPTEIVWRDHE